MDRRAKLLSKIDIRTQKGLEIGALDRPVVGRDEGLIRYADHASTNDLRHKYQDDKTVNTSDIVDVDFVLGEKTFAEAIGREHEFDYVIASHVIEHVPDVIGWLQDISEILCDGGILSLAVPDKRFSFDYFRTATTCGALIEAHMRKIRRPSPKQVFDHLSTAVIFDTGLRWSGKLDEARLKTYHSVHFAAKAAEETFHDGKYVDVHCTIYTPKTFFQIIDMLSELDLIDFRVVDFHDTAEDELEFFVSFEKLTSSDDLEKQRFLKRQSIPRIELDSWERAQQRRFEELEKTINRLARQNDQLLRERDMLDAQLAEANRQLEITRNSTSWRITEPMRRLKLFLLRLRGSSTP